MRTMRVGHPLITGSVVWSVLLWGSSWVAQGSFAQSQNAAQGTDNQTPADKSGPTAKHKLEKEKHWSGSLVDANCMVKAMSTPTGGTDENSGRPNANTSQRDWLTEGPGQTTAPSVQMGAGQSPRQTGHFLLGKTQTRIPISARHRHPRWPGPTKLTMKPSNALRVPRRPCSAWCPPMDKC